MSRKFILLGLAAVLVSACQSTPPEPEVRNADGMVDPATGALVEEFNDQTFSMADIYAERLKSDISNSDRRSMDTALDEVLSRPPRELGERWSNPVTQHKGDLDLVSWQIDRRLGELCGTFEHTAYLGETLSGVVIICRANTDPAWTVDEVVWKKADPKTAHNTPRRTVTYTEPKARRTPQTQDRPPKTPRVSTGSAGQRPPGYVPPPCPDATAGAVALGDCLAAPN
ncbi:MAG: hypothetical protein AAF074_17805 [Pseudomonadota bacterium]